MQHAVGSWVQVIADRTDYDSDAEAVQRYVGVVLEHRDRAERSTTKSRWYDPTTGGMVRSEWWVPDRYLEPYVCQAEVGDTVFVPDDIDRGTGDDYVVRGGHGVVTHVDTSILRADWTGCADGRDRRGWWVNKRSVLCARKAEPPSVERIREYLIRTAPSKGWTREWVNEHLVAMGLDPWEDEATVTVTVRVGGATGIRAEDLVVTSRTGTVRSVTPA